MSEVHNPSGCGATRAWNDGDLAAMLASRICHDLTSPLGAIANGVELLSLSGVDPSPEMALIAESVESANARLRFFRLAYGTDGPQPIGRAEVVRTLAALSRGGRHAYEWTVVGDFPRTEVKTVFLLLQCLEAAMPMGGRLRVTREGERWEVVAEGPRLRSDLPGWALLGTGELPPPGGAAQVQFTLLAGMLASLGRSLVLTMSPDRIEAGF